MTEGDRRVFSGKGHVSLSGDGASSFDVSYMVLEEDVYRLHYEVVSSSLLWFALHGIFDVTRRPVVDRRLFESWERGYAAVNRAFAEACRGYLSRLPSQTPAAVLFQDYHLFLAPSMLGKRESHHKSVFFVHTAFPPPQGLGVLPGAWVREVLEGLLSCDLVGFHSRRWASEFAACCKKYLGADVVVRDAGADQEGLQYLIHHRDAQTAVGVFPLGPEAESLLSAAGSAEVTEEERNLGVEEGDFVVASVERVDPAKNSLRSLRAVDELLETVPEIRPSLRYLLFLYPSRARLPEYRAYESECASYASFLNEKWEYLGRPVVLFDSSDSYEKSLAALRRYDVLFVNSLADGMNLVAREGPIVNRRDGVLVLSSGTGASDLYGEAALLVNPFDISEQAAAIEEAWAFSPAERRERASRLVELATSHSPKTWLSSQLEAVFAI